MDDRGRRYRELVDARKACRLCADVGLVNASAVCAGRFDSADIGPWTGSLGDLHARLMVVGQDWGDQRAFVNQAGRDWPTSATNRMLRELLREAGVELPHSGVGDSSGVFLTNAVLCFRTEDGCQGPVQERWFQNCGTRFLRPQIELVAPDAVVCLGQRAYGALMAAYRLPQPKNWRAAVDGEGVALPGETTAFAVYHCGRRILNSHRKRDQQLADWRRIGMKLARASRDIGGEPKSLGR